MGFRLGNKKTHKFIIWAFLFGLFLFPVSTFAKEDKDDIELPQIFITGNISEMDNKNDKRKITFKYKDDEKTIESNAKIKLQGAYSLLFEKKNYTIDFYSDDAYKNKNDVDFGWGAHSKYALKANWMDNTHARNIVTANIVANINKKYNFFTDTPNYGEVDGFPVEVYVNNEFFGLYTLNIPKSDWMLGMDKNNVKHMLFSSDHPADSNLFKTKVGFDIAWDLEIGDDEGYAVAQLNKAVDFIMNSSDEEFKNNLNNYFDLDNLLNYFVMVEFADLADNFSKNILAVTYDGNKWFLVLYDLDLSWGAWFDRKLDYEIGSGIETNLLFERLRKNFPNELANRYFALRKTILTKDNILDKFHEFEAKIPQSIVKKEQKKWGETIGFDVSQVEEFLDVRIPVMDKFFYDLYTITPQVHLEYELDAGFAKVMLVSNREDITINGSQNDSDELIFMENGFYKVTYQDWFGNYTDSLDAGITSINKKPPLNFPLYITIAALSSIFCLSLAIVIIRRLIIIRESHKACLKRKNSVKYKKKGK